MCVAEVRIDATRMSFFVKAFGTLGGKLLTAGAASAGAVGAYNWSQVLVPQTPSTPV